MQEIAEVLKRCDGRGTGSGIGMLPIPSAWQMGLVTNV